METLLNLKAITYINRYDIQEHHYIYYQEPKSYFFGLFKQHEGFVDLREGGEYIYSKEDILTKEENIRIENNTVFYKPHIEIQIGDEQLIKWFDSMRQIDDYISDLETLSGIRFTKL